MVLAPHVIAFFVMAFFLAESICLSQMPLCRIDLKYFSSFFEFHF